MIQMRIPKQLLVATALVGATVSCGDVARQGQSPVYLVMNWLEARQGNETTYGSFLLSDVLTLVRSPAPCSPASPCPTIFNDVGRVEFSLALKDRSNPALAPTSNNAVTIKRYRIAYKRADGRNTPGVDVPYPFDGAATVTVPPNGTAEYGFEWVRHAAKMESPLVQLVYSSTIITTIADVTFYGTDQVGNDISVSGSMQVDFGNFGDF
jgi:hypothetical protein